KIGGIKMKPFAMYNPYYEKNINDFAFQKGSYKKLLQHIAMLIPTFTQSFLFDASMHQSISVDYSIEKTKQKRNLKAVITIQDQKENIINQHTVVIKGAKFSKLEKAIKAYVYALKLLIEGIHYHNEDIDNFAEHISHNKEHAKEIANDIRRGILMFTIIEQKNRHLNETEDE